MLHRTVSVSLRPGDALLFDGDLLHGTPPNDSRRRRRALQFHYAAAHCRPSRHVAGEITDPVDTVFTPDLANRPLVLQYLSDTSYV
jgi:ectoine hydroxylase-related dioxygenase (phytanoyl-CoA dioxygenase family)